MIKIGDRFWISTMHGPRQCTITSAFASQELPGYLWHAKIDGSDFDFPYKESSFFTAELDAYAEYVHLFFGQLNRCRWPNLTGAERDSEDDGQLSIFFKPNDEPPDPDDYPDFGLFEAAWEVWAEQYPETAKELSRCR